MPVNKPTPVFLATLVAYLSLAIAAPFAIAAPADYEGISADGKVAFFSTTDKLVSGDTDNRRDVYMRSFDSGVGSYVTREISTGPSGGNDAFDAFFDRSSSDGTKVFFSTDERLVGGDTDKAGDVYLRDIAKGLTVLVTKGESACAPACGNADAHADFAEAGASGAVVLFSTKERLAAADTDSVTDLYRRDLDGETTLLVSAGEASCQPACGNGALPATLSDLSDDGSKAFFTTEEPLAGADTDTAIDAYARDLPGGPTTLVSQGDAACTPCGSDDSSDVTFAGGSENGTVAFFETDEGLVPGDDDDGNDVYRRAGGATTLVSGGSAETPANFRAASSSGARVFFVTTEALVIGDANIANDVYQWQGGAPSLVTSGSLCCGSTFDAASADGTMVVFTTAEKLDLVADTDGSADVYEQEIGGGAPTLISRGAGSCAPACGNGSLAATFNRVSADATKIFFSSTEALAEEDGDSDADVYVRDLSGPATALVSTEGVFCPIPGGCDASFRGTSGNGGRVFFQTTERLTEGDVDSELDVYERASAQTRLVTTGNSVELGPSTPVLTGTNPASPGTSTSPGIVGQADPGTAIKLYKTADCSGEVVATGTSAQLGGAGVAATVAAGSTTSFRAAATDVSGDTSACSNAVSYTQASAPPPPPPPPGGDDSDGGGSSSGGSSKGGSPGGAKGGSNPGVAYVTPHTRITFAPAGKTAVRRPVFRFTDSTEQQGTTFRCKVDRTRWRSCSSPVKLKVLKLGWHVFQVKAANAVGEKEPAPQKRKFKVVAG
jgi:Tol biopolymer transport system component